MPFTDVWIKDASELLFADGTFDAVICFQVLSVLKQPEKFFSESFRVLREDGYLLITTDFLYRQWSEENVMRHTEKDQKMMAEEAGYFVVVLESFGGIHAMVYRNLSVYFRDYSHQFREAANPLIKFLKAIGLLFILVFTPLFSLWGWVVYLMERNQRKALSARSIPFSSAGKNRVAGAHALIRRWLKANHHRTYDRGGSHTRISHPNWGVWQFKSPSVE